MPAPPDDLQAFREQEEWEIRQRRKAIWYYVNLAAGACVLLFGLGLIAAGFLVAYFTLASNAGSLGFAVPAVVVGAVGVIVGFIAMDDMKKEF